jgi:PBP1b-binding outer membrane lipoprotein LpoB
MKRQLLVILSALLLTACSDKNEYEQAVLVQMQKEQQLQKELGVKDYQIPSEDLTQCVVDTSSQNMAGLFAYDPARLMDYRNYTKMLAYRSYAKELVATKVDNPKQALDNARKQLVTDFSSEKALNEAMANYADSLESCYTAIISKSEEADKAK